MHRWFLLPQGGMPREIGVGSKNAARKRALELGFRQGTYQLLTEEQWNASRDMRVIAMRGWNR